MVCSVDRQPRTLLEAVRHFDPETCHRYIGAIKWPSGACCPKCGSVNVGEIKSRRRFQCREKACRAQFSLTTDTIMEGTHLRLDQWILGVWQIVNCKNGVSSCEIARAIGCKQQSAWHLLHRVRHILKAEHSEPMRGTVEADATFVGGLFQFMNHEAWQRARKSHRPKNKSVVHALKCRNTGQVRASVIPGERRDAIEPIVRENVAHGSYLFTDGGRAYRWARYTNDYRHAWVDHFMEYVRGAVHVNGCECYFNCLRRGLKGTYIRPSHGHIGAYVDEQSFRFNHRKESDWERFDRAMRLIVGKRLTYSALTGGKKR